MNFSKVKSNIWDIEYPEKGFKSMRQKVKAIMDLTLAANNTEARHKISLIAIIGNSFLYLVM